MSLMHLQMNSLMPILFISLAMLLLALFLGQKEEQSESKPAPSEMLQEAISRYPGIEKIISDELKSGKVLTVKDLMVHIENHRLFIEQDSIRQRQLSSLKDFTNSPHKD